MPQKIQVDESFAFLFMCIEASGMKIDFRLVGDATDLQPAAARMRYTRLKKAVEEGVFRGAILQQGPTFISPQLAAMSNPESRRLAAVPGSDRPASRPRKAAKGLTRPTAKVAASARVPITYYSDDEEDGEEEEQEEEAEVEEDSDTLQMQKRKFVASNAHREGLFFPDTSTATRKVKKIKRSDSDNEAEEVEVEGHEEWDIQSARSSNTIAEESRATNSGAQCILNDLVRKPGFHTGPGSFATFSRSLQQRIVPRSPASRVESSSVQSSRDVQGGDIAKGSRRVGIVSGQLQPTQEDISFAETTGQSPWRTINASPQSLSLRAANVSAPPKTQNFPPNHPFNNFPPRQSLPLGLPNRQPSSFGLLGAVLNDSRPPSVSPHAMTNPATHGNIPPSDNFEPVQLHNNATPTSVYYRSANSSQSPHPRSAFNDPRMASALRSSVTPSEGLKNGGLVKQAQPVAQSETVSDCQVASRDAEAARTLNALAHGQGGDADIAAAEAAQSAAEPETAGEASSGAGDAESIVRTE